VPTRRSAGSDRANSGYFARILNDEAATPAGTLSLARRDSLALQLWELTDDGLTTSNHLMQPCTVPERAVEQRALTTVAVWLN
jgi:hypothetical protein